MNELHKEYGRPFVLEATKLTRVVIKARERLEDHQPTMKQDQFDVFFSATRHQKLNTLEEVLQLDNSHKERIQRLIITCSGGRKVAARHEHEIQIDFGGKLILSNTSVKGISIKVRSDDTVWANRALSELEEQIERTWQAYTQPVLLLVGLLVLGLVILGLQLTSGLEFRLDNSRTMWLRDPDLDRLDHLVANGRTLTEEEMREIETMRLRNLLDVYRPKQSPPPHRNLQLAFVGIPVFFLVTCGFFQLFTCYPTVVFRWGDEEARYSAILQRRKNLWNIILGVAVIGILSNLLYAGLASWLS